MSEALSKSSVSPKTPETTEQIINKILTSRKLTTSAREELQKTIRDHSENIAAVKEQTRAALAKFLENNSKYGTVSQKFKDFSKIMIPKLQQGKIAPGNPTTPETQVPVKNTLSPINATAKNPGGADDIKTSAKTAEPSTQESQKTENSIDASSNTNVPEVTETSVSETNTPKNANETEQDTISRIRETLGQTTLQLGSRTFKLPAQDIKVEPVGNGTFVLGYGKLDMVTKTPIIMDKNGQVITQEIQVQRGFLARTMLSDVPDGTYKIAQKWNVININKA